MTDGGGDTDDALFQRFNWHIGVTSTLSPDWIYVLKLCDLGKISNHFLWVCDPLMTCPVSEGLSSVPFISQTIDIYYLLL